MELTWVAPLSASAAVGTRKSPSQDTRRIRVASEFSPQVSPAPANNGTIVPEGWIRQMGDEGETDVSLGDTRNGPLQYDATFTPITVPIFSGGWPLILGNDPQIVPGPQHWGVLYDDSLYDDDVYAG
jgi:hypothetical protein